MMKSELKKKIENAAAKIKNGEYALSIDATTAVFSGEIPFDWDDGEEIYFDEDGEEVVKTIAFVEKRDDKILVSVNNGECYPPYYAVDEFVEMYGE